MASKLSNTFILYCHRQIVINLFCHVDNLFMVATIPSYHAGLDPPCRKLKIFLCLSFPGSKFSHEYEENSKMQILDLEISLGGIHRHWVYSPVSKRDILSYNLTPTNFLLTHGSFTYEYTNDNKLHFLDLQVN